MEVKGIFVTRMKKTDAKLCFDEIAKNTEIVQVLLVEILYKNAFY